MATEWGAPFIISTYINFTEIKKIHIYIYIENSWSNYNWFKYKPESTAVDLVASILVLLAFMPLSRSFEIWYKRLIFNVNVVTQRQNYLNIWTQYVMGYEIDIWPIFSMFVVHCCRRHECLSHTYVYSILRRRFLMSAYLSWIAYGWFIRTHGQYMKSSMSWYVVICLDRSISLQYLCEMEIIHNSVTTCTFAPW